MPKIHPTAFVDPTAVLADDIEIGAYCIVEADVVIGPETVLHDHAMHVPPFTLFAGANRVVSLNGVGIRRSKEITTEDRRHIRRAFDLTYRSSLTLSDALRAMDEHTEWGAAASCFRDFVRQVISAQPPFNRGISPLRRRDPNSGETKE